MLKKIKYPKIVLSVGAVLISVGFVIGVKVADLPALCGSCHSMKPHLETWEANIHSKKGVDCMDCHVKPGLFNHAIAHVMAVAPWKEKKSFLKDEYGFHDQVAGFDIKAMSFEGKTEAEKKGLIKKCKQCHPNRLGTSYFLHGFKQNKHIINDNCRRCHPEILKLSAQKKDSNIHKIHLAQKIQCIQCHARVVHSPHPENPLPDKGICRKCHQRKSSFT